MIDVKYINKTNFLWFIRVIQYAFNYFLIEKPRGIDFSMRQREFKTYKGSSGYSLTSKSALSSFLNLDISAPRKKFIDVGGGKGGTAYFATQLGFPFATSLEYEPSLHEIAKSNIHKLKMGKKIELVCADAFEWNDYSLFSHIFLFRPLNGKLMENLLEHIYKCIESNPLHDKYCLMLYGGIEKEHIVEALLRQPGTSLYVDDLCPYRNTNRRIIHICPL